MIYLYRLFYVILKFVLQRVRPAGLDSWLQLREKPLPTATLQHTYWFHAASGEIEYCKSVIRLLKQQKPQAQVVVTYTSPSAEKLFHNIKDCVDLFLPLPWDRPREIKNLITLLNPSILVFSRTDLWPELIHQARLKKIPLGIISALPCKTLSQKWLRPKFDFVSLVETDGDTRFDQVFYRLSQPSRFHISAYKKTFVCGSTWSQDEEVLFPVFEKLVKRDLHIVLSPHDVSAQNIARVRAEIEQRNLKDHVTLIDTVGVLADAYRTAHVAFVGGSFRDKIHSVMEPLCCGIPVLTGPFYENNPEAVKYAGQFVFPCRNSAEVLQNFERCEALVKEQIQTEMLKNRNASNRVLSFILRSSP
jgi:3-deoxy-D-manno-octulosonic-acid transferase